LQHVMLHAGKLAGKTDLKLFRFIFFRVVAFKGLEVEVITLWPVSLRPRAGAGA